jgi:hypothetical protein
VGGGFQLKHLVVSQVICLTAMNREETEFQAFTAYGKLCFLPENPEVIPIYL